jgi:hypothetical protein
MTIPRINPPERPSGGDLADHHGRRQRHHEPRAPFVVLVPGTKEHVVVRPLVDRVRMHSKTPKAECRSIPQIGSEGENSNRAGKRSALYQDLS